MKERDAKGTDADADADADERARRDDGAGSPPPGQEEVAGATDPGAVAEPDGQGSGAGEASPADAGECRDELGVARIKAEEYLALAQRTQADFENYRKRVARDAAVAESRGIGRLAKELMPALDNLALALAAADAEGEGSGHLADGIRLVQAELHAALKRVGIEAFSPQGEAFDPELHEAMAAQPAEGVAPGTVIEVYQQGYRYKDTVLRPARVVVSAAEAA
ncbi:MAG: nucleotide exchange factor GrpE [Solirubrobacterales bacterium]|nr:MAG: nucleotide exchange factor GrpE [Solirubrobacterales bacterium]PZS10610.1 MAG: nucleotide exchange factor GrpE [Solirubrobacterales bacterium]